MEHLAIMKRGYIEKLLSGEKRIKSRFSVNRITPFRRIAPGDKVYLQETGKPVTASFTAGEVLFFSDLDEQKIAEIRTTYGPLICADEAFWASKQHARYATLIFVERPTLEPPFKVRKSDRSAFKTASSIKALAQPT